MHIAGYKVIQQVFALRRLPCLPINRIHNTFASFYEENIGIRIKHLNESCRASLSS